MASGHRLSRGLEQRCAAPPTVAGADIWRRYRRAQVTSTETPGPDRLHSPSVPQAKSMEGGYKGHASARMHALVGSESEVPGGRHLFEAEQRKAKRNRWMADRNWRESVLRGTLLGTRRLTAAGRGPASHSACQPPGAAAAHTQSRRHAAAQPRAQARGGQGGGVPMNEARDQAGGGRRAQQRQVSAQFIAQTTEGAAQPGAAGNTKGR